MPEAILSYKNKWLNSKQEEKCKKTKFGFCLDTAEVINSGRTQHYHYILH